MRDPGTTPHIGLLMAIAMIGPLATIAMGVIWLDEPFTPWLLAGTALVLAGIYLVTRPAGGATTSGEPG